MTTTTASLSPPRPGAIPRRWTRDEYYRAGELGVFRPDERLELINGEIFSMSPIGSNHSVTVSRIFQFLAAAFPHHYVAVQQPVTISDLSEPEPDVVVAVGSVDRYEDHHPTPDDVRLVVEVSDTSLRHDRRTKARLYADAGIVEYWIVDLKARSILVHREPAVGGYRSIATLTDDDLITPFLASSSSIVVSKLLPRKH
jgi:Uma2 family endonuclease